jgi:hypothetical protein
MVKGSLRSRGVLPLVAGEARFTREKGSLRSREMRNARIAMLLLKTVSTETESRLPIAPRLLPDRPTTARQIAKLSWNNGQTVVKQLENQNLLRLFNDRFSTAPRLLGKSLNYRGTMVKQ